ncbi:SPOR domain-containing protein [Sphingomonas sp. S1-29]|uniref:SPOR domain-containing protein n=1 Tax=Sphingomonas sp. S1-29 TaxID=2991074 RepID=UPI00223F2E64|nr:SPOR domain-containing protein [Sphingomonas sp. S1-29]UZK70006.1 SPOR domain-containing protein [Sphingomonas sp. S1-29]
MKSRAEFLILGLLGAAASAQDAPPAEVVAASGPLGTSGEVKRYDEVGAVGLASALDSPIGAAHATLPVGSVAEVTALDTGRTILVPIAGQVPAAGQVIALAPGALSALGIAAQAGVRVRSVTPSPQDQAALQAGRPGLPRLDAPPVLLNGLRKQMAAVLPAPTPMAPPKPVVAKPAPKPASPRPVPTAPAPPNPAATGTWFVQVAALSSEPRARALASQLNGRSIAAGRFWRVQLGPFPDAAAANSARARAARSGYRDATVFRSK